MNSKIPRKISESSAIPQVRNHAIVINQLIDALASMDIKESPGVRIERTANGTTVHFRRSAVAGGTDDTWY